MPSKKQRPTIGVIEAFAVAIAFHKCTEPSDKMLDDPKVSARLTPDGLGMFVRFSDRLSPKGTSVFTTTVPFEDINNAMAMRSK